MAINATINSMNFIIPYKPKERKSKTTNYLLSTFSLVLNYLVLLNASITKQQLTKTGRNCSKYNNAILPGWVYAFTGTPIDALQIRTKINPR